MEKLLCTIGRLGQPLADPDDAPVSAEVLQSGGLG